MAACVPAESGGCIDLQLFQLRPHPVDFYSFRAWLASSGYGPGTGLANPRLYWALHWLSETLDTYLGVYGEEFAMAYFEFLCGAWEAGDVDIEAIFEAPDFIDGSRRNMPHWDSYYSALEECGLSEGDLAPSSDASD